MSLKIAVLSLTLVAAAPARAQDGVEPTFPEVVAARPDGPPRKFRLRTGKPVEILSYRLTPSSEASRDATAAWCGVALIHADGARSTLVTVGRGPLETVSCDRLRSVRLIAPVGERPRFELIYDVRSPNAASRATAILTTDARGDWGVDDAATGRAASPSPKSPAGATTLRSR